MSPDTLATLTRAFEKLDAILPDARDFHLSPEGIRFSYSRSVGYRGEYETVWETIWLPWDQFLDPEGDYLALETQCVNAWNEAQGETKRLEQEARAEAARKAQLRAEQERRDREEETRLAPALKEAADRATYEELRKRFGGGS